jgi:hypothetical protein
LFRQREMSFDLFDMPPMVRDNVGVGIVVGSTADTSPEDLDMDLANDSMDLLHQVLTDTEADYNESGTEVRREYVHDSARVEMMLASSIGSGDPDIDWELLMGNLNSSDSKDNTANTGNSAAGYNAANSAPLVPPLVGNSGSSSNKTVMFIPSYAPEVLSPSLRGSSDLPSRGIR